MSREQVTMKFYKNEDDMKAMAAFLAEMQRQGGEVFISQESEYFTVVLLGM